MQQSIQHACPSGHVGHRWTIGNPDRTPDQGELGDGYSDRDVSKYMDEYKICKSSKTPDCGNDSGFVETYHSVDTDDTSGWRKDYMHTGVLLTPNICSTPIREPSSYFPRIDITGSCAAVRGSPLNYEHVSPVPVRFSPRASTGSLPIGMPAFPPSRNPNDNEYITHCDTDNDMVTDRSYNDQYQASELSRGHRTIASMLKSLPLNMTSSKPSLSPSKQNCQFECLSDLPQIVHNTDLNKPSSNAEQSENNASSVHVECLSENYQCPRYDDALPKNCKQRLFATGLQYSDISDGEETVGVDENNNADELAPKYSDISDACASDAGSQVESSSSEEEVANTDIGVNKPRLPVVKRGRKLSVPRRSASKVDPKFRGVSVWLQTSFQNGTSGLQISAFYSNVNTRPPKRRKSKSKNQGRWSSSRSWSCSDHEEGVATPYPKDNSIAKTCASCKTRRTPLWRDAEDGTPLCNACGIRYKKYRLRCSKCWHIPKKEVKTYPNCPACGGPLRYSSHKKAW